MRLIIDLQGAQGSNQHRGIGRYCLSLTKSMIETCEGHEVFVALSALFPETIEPIKAALTSILPADRIIVWQAPARVYAADPQNDPRRIAAELLREATLARVSPDYILVTSMFEGLHDDVVTSVGQLYTSIPTAAVLFDLIPLINPALYLASPIVASWYQNKLGQIRRADLLLTISESARQEALEHLATKPSCAVNISTAADEHFTPAPVSDARRKHLAREFGLDRPFVLYTGGIDHRKNVEGLIEAFSRLPASVRLEHQLAIVCSVSAAEKKRLEALAVDFGLVNDELVLTGYIPDEDLLTCYRACKLFVFPSWHEGFGLPALEAMQCGRAVIASNTSSLPEVIGLPNALFDPFDIDSIARKIGDVLVDSGFRRQLEQHGLVQARKFTWEKTARRAWAALERSVASRIDTAAPTVAALPSRPRLAFVSPVPPASSGIADYSAELIPELAQYYRVEVVTDQPSVSDARVTGNCVVRDLAWFERHGQEFDRIVYQFGNSQFHSHMFALLQKFPGVVVLHDFFLSGVAEYRDGIGETANGMVHLLTETHGWHSAMQYYENGPSETGWIYPCNLKVVQDALGVVVHSQYSRQLAKRWYGRDAADDWYVVPLLREPIMALDRVEARRMLGVPETDFIVCSFGVLGPMKLNDRLLAAWLASPLGNDPSCHLIFVGQNNGGEYGAALQRAVRSAKSAGRIEITGWTDAETFRRWLSAADTGVQLRSLSRGETSAAVLDCMNAGLATIVNANGSMAELPRDCVWMLEDEFDDSDLTAALTSLWRNKQRRAELGARGGAFIKQHHQPQGCAQAYVNAIEGSYAANRVGEFGLSETLSRARLPLLRQDWGDLAASIGRNLPRQPQLKRIFVDISELVQRDSKSGIQRVVRAILMHWLHEPPAGWLVEPVYAEAETLGYRYARSFTAQFLGLVPTASDELIEPNTGDIFVGLDLQSMIVPRQKSVLENWYNSGVNIYFIVYDLLPVVLSEHFLPGARVGHQAWLELISRFTGLICISRSVADELRDWLDHYGPARHSPLVIDWFHLGADTESSAPTSGFPVGAQEVLSTLRKAPSFLSVGTIEPRKGYRQVLAAFDLLWEKGTDVNLVLVGKLGWLMEDFASTVRGHPAFGKRLFWLDSISDEYLDQVYAACRYLIAASAGEGFGLPLIEAGRHGLPVLARDIPVFREIGGDIASYFDDSNDPAVISDAILELLSTPTPKSEAGEIPWLTWAQSAQALLDAVLGDKQPYQTWKPDNVLRFWGNDSRLYSQFGERFQREIRTDGHAGFLVYGPYMPLKAGTYRIVTRGKAKVLTGDEYLDMSSNVGEQVHMKAFVDRDGDQWSVSHTFTIVRAVKDFEIRLWVSEATELSLRSVEITQIS